MSRTQSVRSLLAFLIVLSLLTGIAAHGATGGARLPPTSLRSVEKFEGGRQAHLHLPNESQPPCTDDLATLCFHSLIASLIGVTVLVIFVPISKTIFKRFARLNETALPAVQQVISIGNYTGADRSCTLTVPRDKRHSPLLNVVTARESYLLKAEQSDHHAGTAHGRLVCTTHGNDAGKWTLSPFQGIPNQRMLIYQILDRPPMETTLLRNT